MTNKKAFKLGIFLISILLLAGIVSAFGISGSNGPFTVSPGGTTVTSLRLQNMVGDADINVQADITKGNEVASIIGNNRYLVEFGTKDTEVPIKIQVPSDVPIGTIYTVVVSIRTISGGDAQGVAFGIGMDQDIQILVVPETKEKTQFNPIWIVVIGAGVLIAVGAVVFLMKKKKVKKKR